MVSIQIFVEEIKRLVIVIFEMEHRHNSIGKTFDSWECPYLDAENQKTENWSKSFSCECKVAYCDPDEQN